MRPEKKIVNAIWDDVCDRSGFDLGALDADVQDEIRAAWSEIAARAIRAAENAALERAAKCVEGRPYMSTFPEAIAAIRSLKSRAPKRKAGRA